MKRIVAFCILFALLFSLSACGADYYRLTIAGDITFYEKPSTWHRAGEDVVIKTSVYYDVAVTCYVNGVSVGGPTSVGEGKQSHWEFSFIMPSENVTVHFEKADGWRLP